MSQTSRTATPTNTTINTRPPGGSIPWPTRGVAATALSHSLNVGMSLDLRWRPLPLPECRACEPFYPGGRHAEPRKCPHMRRSVFTRLLGVALGSDKRDSPRPRTPARVAAGRSPLRLAFLPHHPSLARRSGCVQSRWSLACCFLDSAAEQGIVTL